MLRPDIKANQGLRRPAVPPDRGKTAVRVIASSLRKGNIVDLEGKLYVVLNAESFHPGKGTPTTQIDMRRISDGVKVSQRYKTTEQVERAYVEDREFQFLYQDGDGFHFMNTENYDQFSLPAEIIGHGAAYLEPEMTGRLAAADWGGVLIARKRHPSKAWRRSPRSKASPRRPPTSQHSSPTACAPWCRRSLKWGPG